MSDHYSFAENLAEKIGPRIYDQLMSRKESLELFISKEIRSEEWFRVEILVALEKEPLVSILETNRAKANGSDRPDFVIEQNSEAGEVELKVLPIDRNFPRGWQAFQAGDNNKRDFENLQTGERDAIIYVHWHKPNDWVACAANLRGEYYVDAVREDVIHLSVGELTISYWARIKK